MLTKFKKRETGYVATGLHHKGEEPLFSLQYVQFQLPSVLVYMTVENNILAAVLDNFRILRIDLDNPLEVDGKQKILTIDFILIIM
jgi:hypothetical protein